MVGSSGLLVGKGNKYEPVLMGPASDSSSEQSHYPVTQVTNINRTPTWAKLGLGTRDTEVDKIDRLPNLSEVTI